MSQGTKQGRRYAVSSQRESNFRDKFHIAEPFPQVFLIDPSRPPRVNRCTGAFYSLDFPHGQDIFWLNVNTFSDLKLTSPQRPRIFSSTQIDGRWLSSLGLAKNDKTPLFCSKPPLLRKTELSELGPIMLQRERQTLRLSSEVDTRFTLRIRRPNKTISFWFVVGEEKGTAPFLWKITLLSRKKKRCSLHARVSSAPESYPWDILMTKNLIEMIRRNKIL